MSIIHLLILCLLAIVCCSRTYPMQKQCNPAWGNQQYEYTSYTICQQGSLLTSISMAFTGTGHELTPETLNKWLKDNDGYMSGVIVLSHLEVFGYRYLGKIPNSMIKKHLDSGNIVISTIAKDQFHWVLNYGYNGDTIMVNDPMKSAKSYQISEFLDNVSAVYQVTSQNEAEVSLRKQKMIGE